MEIPLARLDITEREIKAVVKVLETSRAWAKAKGIRGCDCCLCWGSLCHCRE